MTAPFTRLPLNSRAHCSAESDLPSTLDPATIYAITDSGETEIEKLIIRGMEFAGGGIPDTGEPMISSPSNGSTINLGTNEGSGASKTITVKGKNLTGDLTVAVGTGLEISYGQTLNASSVTIPMAQALLGAQVTISYSGSGELDDGSLVITHGNDVLSSVVVVVVVVAWQEVDLSSLEKDYHWLDASGMYSYETNNGKYSVLLGTNGFNKIRFTPAPNKTAIFLFLKNRPSVAQNQEQAYASDLCAGETGRRVVSAGTVESFTIPSDCVYVMIGMQASSSAPNGYAPSKVETI